MSAKGKMTAARTALVLDHPFWGTLALYLKMQPDPGCQTAWVDGRTLGYEPAFIESLSHDQVVGLLAHEVSHCAMGHPWRRDGRDLKGWNIACDKAINPDLRDSGFKLPPDGLYATGPEQGKSAEWIYAHLQQRSSQQPQPQPGAGQGQQSQQPGKAPQQPQPQQPGQPGADESQPNPLGEVRDAPNGPDADGSPAPSAEDWKQRVSRAAQQAKMAGKLGAGMQRQVGRAIKTRIDPHALLHRFFTERAAADFSWVTPNPRYVCQGLYMPALQSHSLGELAILVDTSGSVNDVALQFCRGIIEQLIEELTPAGVTLYFVDAAVQHIQRLERGEPLIWEPKGGGGTNFTTAFDTMEKAEIPPVCIVAISDLEATFPTAIPSIPVLWLTDNEDVTAPFGETVFVNR